MTLDVPPGVVSVLQSFAIEVWEEASMSPRELATQQLAAAKSHLRDGETPAKVNFAAEASAMAKVKALQDGHSTKHAALQVQLAAARSASDSLQEKVDEHVDLAAAKKKKKKKSGVRLHMYQ